MLDKNVIDDSLVKYNLADSAIQKMADEFLPLTISGLEDKKGFETVHSARMVVKNHRVQVESTRKELKDKALRYGRAVDAEAKRLTALLTPIEEHLATEESRITDMKAAIKREAEEKRQREIEAREQALREELERKRQEQEAQLAAQRAEQEREAAKLAAERAELEAERQRVEAERRAVEAEKQRAIEAERRRAELEQARKEAAERARREAELEAERKAEAERRAEIERYNEEVRRLAEAPDKEKLQKLILPYWPIILPPGEFKTKAAKAVLETFETDLDNALEKVRRFIDG